MRNECQFILVRRQNSRQWDGGISDDKSTLIQVMAWCRQATSHYLNQCWPGSLPPYGVTRPQWVKPHTSPLIMLPNSDLHNIMTWLLVSYQIPPPTFLCGCVVMAPQSIYNDCQQGLWGSMSHFMSYLTNLWLPLIDNGMNSISHFLFLSKFQITFWRLQAILENVEEFS